MNTIVVNLQVPGQLLGYGDVDLAVTSNGVRDVLYLGMSNQPAIFAYPGDHTVY